MLTLQQIARALGGEVSGNQVIAPAPGHSAKDRGMVVTIGRDGRPLAHLFNGGDPLAAKDEVCRKCGLEPFKPNGKGKAECSGGIRQVTRQVIYDYCDPASGEVRYRKRRIERADGSKTFAIEPKGRGGSHPLLYGGERLADLVEGQAVWIVEGEKQVDRLRDLGATAVSGDSGFQSKWLPEHAELLRDLPVILWPDSDEPGEKYISNAAAAILAADPNADIRVVRPFAVEGVPDGSKRDVCDWEGDATALAELAAGTVSYNPFVGSVGYGDRGVLPEKNPFVGSVGYGGRDVLPKNGGWTEPVPVPDGILPVAGFDAEFLPKAIADWVMDIADRMQCPPDFVGIPAIVALGSVIGRKVAVRPQRKTDWFEVANLWGCAVGRPGMMKSPAMGEALKPLHRFEAEARKVNDVAAKDYAAEVEAFKLRKEDAQKKGREAIKAGRADLVALLSVETPEEPKTRRYVVNDTTYEALGEILAVNPNGVLAFRDELVSLLKTLDREEYSAARGFFLTAWNGTSGYTFDRIGRGKTHIDAACLSLLGSTQPGRLADYMRSAISGGAADDGMIQRFSLLVWPDQSRDWKNTDRYPASEPRAAAWAAFEHLNELTPATVMAECDMFSPVPFHRFDETAQGVFAEWHYDLETRLRGDDIFPALESHLSKYRKLVPALALINHLADRGTGAISERAVLRALAFATYLETHAKRAYGAGVNPGSHAARAILKHIRSGDLKDGFTGRDILIKGWSGVSAKDQVDAGLDILAAPEFGWLRAERMETGGRPTIAYLINPATFQ